MDQGFSILELGYLNLSRSDLVGNGDDGKVKSPVVGFLVRKGDLTLLFDAGLDSRRLEWDVIQQESNFLPNQLKTLGIRTSTIDAVVISHLHADHVGFLNIFRDTSVPILVQQEELEDARRPNLSAIEKRSVRAEDFDFGDLDYVELSGDYEIDHGLELIHLPGHTKGSQGLLLETNTGRRVFFSSDAVYTLGNFGPPRKKQGRTWNEKAWGNSVERIRLFTKLRKAELFPGHDAEFYGKKKYAPYVYL